MKNYLYKKKVYHNIQSTCRFLVFLFILGFSYTNFAQETDSSAKTLPKDTIRSGVQGSINPMLDQSEVLTRDDLLDKSFPNSWPLFGSDIRMRIGGFVKADFIQDLDYIGDAYEFELGSIPIDGSPLQDLGGASTFHAKQSRFNLDYRSKAKWKSGKEFPMQVFVEVDWFFDSPAMRLNTRLRLAYGVIGRLLVGQSWTNSGDLTSLPGLIDFSSGDAIYGGRVNQIRWQDKIGKKFTYVVALEEGGSQIDNTLNQDGASRIITPNLAANVRYQADNGSSVQFGVDAFTMSWKGSSTVADNTKTGYALSLTGRLTAKINHYQDALLYGGGFGEGIGHKIIALSWDGKGSGALSQDGLLLNQAWWGFVGFNHYWTKNLNSTISAAWTQTNLQEVQSDNTIAEAGSFHVNLIWFPYPLISTGIEYMWGMRENKNGDNGSASRLQFMVKFKFN